MTNDFEVKKKTIQKLKEESGTVCKYAGLILFIYGIAFALSLFLLICSIIFSDIITSALTASGDSGILASIITEIASAGTEQRPLNSLGQFNSALFISNIAETIVSSGMICYVTYSIRRIFLSIEQGETPFTEHNISHWQKCSHIFSALAVCCFLLACITRGVFLFAIVTPLLASCFFYAIALVFEYGSCLQTESDETL